MALSDIDLALVVLYRELTEDLGPDQLEQLGDAGQVQAFAETDVASALANLTEAVDLTVRFHRYAASLAYVLGVRLDTAPNEVGALGAKLLDRFPDVVNPGEAESHLREAIQRLLGDPHLTDDVVGAFRNVCNGALEAALVDGTWSFTGTAAEAVTMLSELATMEVGCRSNDQGSVMVDGKRIPVTKVEYEMCTNAPWERSKAGVDPRNWPQYNPLVFRSIDVIVGNPATSGDWTGVVQEKVGPLFSGTPLRTNLSITYMERPGMAVAAYDLAGSGFLPAGDGKVTVDYGFVSLVDEGPHRRFRALKVVHINDMPLSHNWLCPLWAHQMVTAGWWF